MCVSLCSDSGVGPQEHEGVPAGLDIFTQPGGGVWRAEGGVSRHQEHEEEPQLPQLRPLRQSGNGRVTHATWDECVELKQTSKQVSVRKKSRKKRLKRRKIATINRCYVKYGNMLH